MYLLVCTNLGIYVCKLDSSFEVKVLDSWAIKVIRIS